MLNRVFAVFGFFIAVACSNPSGTDGNRQSTEVQKDSVSTPSETKNILFFGNSLTAGMGLESQTQAFPSIIQHWIDSLDLPYRVINAGLSGETSAAGNERIDWLLNEDVAIFVLELGANDGLRGIPTEETQKNLQRIVDKVIAKYPDCKLVLTGMMVPPSMGGDYGKAFTAIFPALAQKNNMAYVPFLLEGVAGESTLNQQDGIHPTAEGHKILAENVWKVLKPLL